MPHHSLDFSPCRSFRLQKHRTGTVQSVKSSGEKSKDTAGAAAGRFFNRSSSKAEQQSSSSFCLFFFLQNTLPSSSLRANTHNAQAFSSSACFFLPNIHQPLPFRSLSEVYTIWAFFSRAFSKNAQKSCKQTGKKCRNRRTNQVRKQVALHGQSGIPHKTADLHENRYTRKTYNQSAG